MKTHKVEQLIIATVGFFWCFLMWFSTAAFSPSIAAHYHLSIKALGLLASSAIWMAPVGRILAGWAADRFGAPRTFAVILAVCGLVSIASAFTENYTLLFAERVIVAIAGVSFVVGIQHVAQWFNANEIGTAEGLYAGTGNVGAGMSRPCISCAAAPPRATNSATPPVPVAICAARSSSGAVISPWR
jgi:NNP family nitrate/nitrite transporter-like MFS transporter